MRIRWGFGEVYLPATPTTEAATTAAAATAPLGDIDADLAAVDRLAVHLPNRLSCKARILIGHESKPAGARRIVTILSPTVIKA